ncbi:MAG: SMI1/KNR4 family protein [Bacteroidetes bacterium]|nr:SMI1/KNR4 family protein [Bacteroidota bacterium]
MSLRELAHRYIATLRSAGVEFDAGLSASEICDVEEMYGFHFPPDLRDFLMAALPITRPFVDWRNGGQEEIARRLAWPLEGICFDIERNDFWIDAWGERPNVLEDAFDIARGAVAAAPTLIPVYSHRYMPDSPSEEGNPVFSVYQTDIIFYGVTLWDYLENEFPYYFGRQGPQWAGGSKPIEFWSALCE